MNRATQTGDVVVDALNNIHIDPGDRIVVLVLPYAREHVNTLGKFDVLNKCSERTMTELQEITEKYYDGLIPGMSRR